MSVPLDVAKKKVDDVMAQIDKKFQDWRRGRVTGTLSAVKGYIGNRIQRVSNDSRVTQAATGAAAGVAAVAPVAHGFLSTAKVVTNVISHAHIPLISHVADLVSLLHEGADKLIEHIYHQKLSSSFVNTKPDAQQFKKQGEYVALVLTQRIVDAIRKVEAADKVRRDAWEKVADCSTFVDYLAELHYFLYRVDRLNDYNDMLRTWTDQVDKALKALNAQCDEVKKFTYETGTRLVGDYPMHLDKCKSKPCCLFDPDWVKYLYTDKGATVGSHQLTPGQPIPPTWGNSTPPPHGSLPATRTVPQPRRFGAK